MRRSRGENVAAGENDDGQILRAQVQVRVKDFELMLGDEIQRRIFFQNSRADGADARVVFFRVKRSREDFRGDHVQRGKFRQPFTQRDQVFRRGGIAALDDALADVHEFKENGVVFGALGGTAFPEFFRVEIAVQRGVDEPRGNVLRDAAPNRLPVAQRDDGGQLFDAELFQKSFPGVARRGQIGDGTARREPRERERFFDAPRRMFQREHADGNAFGGGAEKLVDAARGNAVPKRLERSGLGGEPNVQKRDAVFRERLRRRALNPVKSVQKRERFARFRRGGRARRRLRRRFRGSGGNAGVVFARDKIGGNGGVPGKDVGEARGVGTAVVGQLRGEFIQARERGGSFPGVAQCGALRGNVSAAGKNFRGGRLRSDFFPGVAVAERVGALDAGFGEREVAGAFGNVFRFENEARDAHLRGKILRERFGFQAEQGVRAGKILRGERAQTERVGERKFVVRGDGGVSEEGAQGGVRGGVAVGVKLQNAAHFGACGAFAFPRFAFSFFLGKVFVAQRAEQLGRERVRIAFPKDASAADGEGEGDAGDVERAQPFPRRGFFGVDRDGVFRRDGARGEEFFQPRGGGLVEDVHADDARRQLLVGNLPVERVQVRNRGETRAAPGRPKFENADFVFFPGFDGIALKPDARDSRDGQRGDFRRVFRGGGTFPRGGRGSGGGLRREREQRQRREGEQGRIFRKHNRERDFGAGRTLPQMFSTARVAPAGARNFRALRERGIFLHARNFHDKKNAVLFRNGDGAAVGAFRNGRFPFFFSSPPPFFTSPGDPTS